MAARVLRWPRCIITMADDKGGKGQKIDGYTPEQRFYLGLCTHLVRTAAA